MTIYREGREVVLTTLSPVPFLVILVPILSISADVSFLLFLFPFSLTMVFFYLLVARSVDSIRAKLLNPEELVANVDDDCENGAYFERFVSVSREVCLGGESEVKPISEYTNRCHFPDLVYSFWGFVTSVLVFLVSNIVLLWLVYNGNLESLANALVPEGAIHNVPLGFMDLQLAFLPIFSSLSFVNQVFIVCVVFPTGFAFLTTAKCLTEVSKDYHRRILRNLVAENQSSKTNSSMLFC
ncbi:hypothetical protein SAMN04488556_4155 [Halostagnicola kamekurae]|uniref:Uncharacterized protein n=1 Tax=Halostagnicola kamekurae TaxID=619731 RepID=A0A1I6UXM2_9EURY|nr:hypothetical protein SAMN04488556_4155 [Halostagnicola kamekurae]